MSLCCVPFPRFVQPDEYLLAEGWTEASVLRPKSANQEQLSDAKGSMICVPPFKSATLKKATVLDPLDYVHTKNTVSGELRMIKGPKLFFPGPYEIITRRERVLTLYHNEYVRFIDSETGAIRLEVGEKMVWMTPTEEHYDQGGKRKAVEIDHETGVLIRDTKDGTLSFYQEQGLFIPNEFQKVEKVQKLIRLEEHESMILVDLEGRFHFMSGDSKEPEKRTFFVPPYFQIKQLAWSEGAHMDRQTKLVSKVDRRPQFLNYDFVCRTIDNVELEVSVIFFYQIVSVEQMIRYTDDAPGDLCHQARSVIIQAVSQVDLEKWMQGFNPIVHNAVSSAHEFYEQRGLKVHQVEVRSFHCKDPAIETVLQQVIQETTNRMCRLQEQESNNEVALFKMRGKIEEEKLKGDLLAIKHQHHRDEWLMEGEAEADRVTAFLQGTEKSGAPLDIRIGLFDTMRKTEIFSKLADSNAQMYFTPEDVDLRILSDTTGKPPKSGKSKAARAMA